jgi:mono/diheme cytochrome c family protein
VIAAWLVVVELPVWRSTRCAWGAEEATSDNRLPTTAADANGKDLYLRHCAACHGERGDGKGIAADFLFPKPRDFRAGRFRLVSTDNYVPTPDDLDSVLVRGMPGSSMPSWAHLRLEERKAIAEQVMEFRRDGIREEFVQSLKEVDDLSDEEIAKEDIQQEIADEVARASTPGETTVVPQFGAPDESAIARGRATYVRLGCASCHGQEGKGDGFQIMVDSEGFPSKARDYTAGIFKGGHDPASLYRRIAFGMPGTPMPSTPVSLASPADIVDLVHFLRSLSDEEIRQSAILQRKQITVRCVASLPKEADAASWSDAEETPLAMTPLWWRDDADPDLRVEAIHDGESIAFRLSWRDETPDHHAATGQTFEDAAALELYRGTAEPFFGMGDRMAAVDVWFWDADRSDPAFAVEHEYPNTVVDIYPFSETAVDTAEYDRPGTRLANQPPVSLPALATGNQIVPGGAATGGSELAAAGPGSVTFRLPRNQAVSTESKWDAGRWTVVLIRRLSVEGPAAGVSLAPGDRVTVAFAVWDGSHHDRNGQKLITIWQDLVLE